MPPYLGISLSDCDGAIEVGARNDEHRYGAPERRQPNVHSSDAYL